MFKLEIHFLIEPVIVQRYRKRVFPSPEKWVSSQCLLNEHRPERELLMSYRFYAVLKGFKVDSTTMKSRRYNP